MASAVALCYLLYKVAVSKKQSKNRCFFLTEIGRTQYLINSCLSVPVTANNTGCNVASISYCVFFLCLISYITPLSLYIWYFFYILKAFTLVPFSGTSKDNFQRIKHCQTLCQLIISMTSYHLWHDQPHLWPDANQPLWSERIFINKDITAFSKSQSWCWPDQNIKV